MDYYDEIKREASYVTAIATQREALKLRFKAACCIYLNGGHFVITPNFMTWIAQQIEMGYETVLLLDENENPIRIDHPEDFLITVTDQYSRALNAYYAAFSTLRQARSAEQVVERV